MSNPGAERCSCGGKGCERCEGPSIVGKRFAEIQAMTHPDQYRLREIQQSIKWVRQDWHGLTQGVQSWCTKAEYLFHRLVAERARAMEAEFKLEHLEDEDTGCCIPCNDMMHKDRTARLDPRHTWDSARWIAEERRKVEGK